jgi:hypothetical protein
VFADDAKRETETATKTGQPFTQIGNAPVRNQLAPDAGAVR